MSREKTLDLKLLRRRLRSAQVDETLLSRILGRPSQYVVERLSGKQPFIMNELMSIADLLNCDLLDFFMY